MMQKIIDYQSVDVNNVSKYLADGWQPWGSPYTTTQSRDVGMRRVNDIIGIQAMVRYSSKSGSATSNIEEITDPTPMSGV